MLQTFSIPIRYIHAGYYDACFLSKEILHLYQVIEGGISNIYIYINEEEKNGQNYYIA